MIVLDTLAEEAKRGAVAAGRPGWTARAIDRWWSRYEPGPDDEILGSDPRRQPASRLDTPTVGDQSAGDARTASAQGRSTERSGDDMSDTAPSGSDAPAEGSGGDDAGTGDAKPEERTFSQADVDAAVKARLAAERKRFGDLNELKRKAAELDKLEAAKKTEVEQLTDRASQAEGRATQAELAVMRLDVAFDKAPEGMPVSKIRALAKRLSGSNQEELEADATELFAEFGDANPTGDGQQSGSQRPKEAMSSVPLPGGDKIQLEEPTDPRELAKRIRS